MNIYLPLHVCLPAVINQSRMVSIPPSNHFPLVTLHMPSTQDNRRLIPIPWPSLLLLLQKLHSIPFPHSYIHSFPFSKPPRRASITHHASTSSSSSRSPCPSSPPSFGFKTPSSHNRSQTPSRFPTLLLSALNPSKRSSF